jgi:hexosaminidase
VTTAPPSFRRGYMLDTSRHFVPTEEILTLLDGMFAAKLNIFH